MKFVRDLNAIEKAFCDKLDATDWKVLGALIQRGSEAFHSVKEISDALCVNITASADKLSKLGLTEPNATQLKITSAGRIIALSVVTKGKT